MTETDRVAEAQALALQVLAYLGRTKDLLPVFLSASGLSPEDLRGSLDDAELHAAVLDFLLMDDRWVIGFAADSGVPPQRVVTLRQALPGADLPHWT